MKQIGIEKINIYGCSCYLDQRKLAVARGLDPEKVVNDFLINTRSLNPPYEDAVTMGANASIKLMETTDPDEIGMLIVGTEGSVDFGKPISTNIIGALGLHPNIRNYETKHACYSGVAAMDAAINWVASGNNHGKKALVISTDFSRKHLNLKEEFVMGGVAAAFIVSDQPDVVEFELEKRGTWTTDAYDTFRPSARDEVGNNEVSLYTYMDAIEGSYNHYVEVVGEDVDFATYFKYVIYHTPFAGIAFQAHRTLTNITGRKPKAEIVEDFNDRIMPALRYSRRVGSTYGSSNFVGLCSLVQSADNLRPGDRIGFYAYGSGAIGEFYSGLIGDGAKKMVRSMDIDSALDDRREVTVDEYEHVENVRETYIENPDFEPDFSLLDNWYDIHYDGKKYLVLKKVSDFYRTYEWS
ncbi:MAG: hypothetical protein CMN78_03945 [Spirochaetales bacterium]|nr:hypothetical protein [Spirochaetales bacterium]